MKIVFVGIHNKPGMEPLDSATKSGKIIDIITSCFRGVDFEKRNLFPVDYLPKGEAAEEMVDQFPIEPDARYILLGTIVNNALGTHLQWQGRCFYHPGFVLRKGSDFKERYIKAVVAHIEQQLNFTK